MEYFKILGQVKLTPSTITELYSVPPPISAETGNVSVIASSTQTALSHLVCCNALSTESKFTVWLTDDNSVTPTASNMIYNDVPLRGNETKMLPVGLVMPGDQGDGTVSGLFVRTNVGDIVFTLTGVEIKG